MKKFLKQSAFGLLVLIIINLAIAIYYEYPAYTAIKNNTHKNHLKWNDIHKNKNTYDLIIIGTSRAYTAFNPTVLDSTLESHSYNMGTSSQDIAETYYSLKEIFDYQKPKIIILDLFLPWSDTVHDFYQTFNNASFFSSNKNKFDLVTKGYGGLGVANYCIPILKFKNYIKQDISSLFSKGNRTKIENNWIRGFLYDTTTVTKEQISKFEPISNFDNTSFNEDRFFRYFHKIKKLVEKHNAKLICVRTPYPPSRFELSDVDTEGIYFKDFMKTTTIPYYDLNLFRRNKYIYHNSDFSDYHHPNYKGANKASMQLSEAIKDIDALINLFNL